MEYKGKQNGARVYDDYAHHPTEIRATLAGARGMLEAGGRLFCVFQSHTYSRTAALLDEFSGALSLADKVAICDIYAARETNIYGITPEIFAAKIEGAVATHGFVEPALMLKEELRAGDVAIIMGAGDVWHVFEHLDLD
jgi:UDP-N-acetylmuramate--alanine ligase